MPDRYELFEFNGVAANSELRQEVLRAAPGFRPHIRSVQFDSVADVRWRILVNDETIAEMQGNLAMGWSDARPLDFPMAEDDTLDIVFVNNTAGVESRNIEVYYTLPEE